jgi:hypothetical protein
MRARRALLSPPDVQGGRPKVDLIPSKVHQLGNTQAVAVSHQNHRGVPVAVAVFRGGLHEPLDLGLGQVFAGPQIAVTTPFGCNCSFYGVWRDQLEV